MIGRRSARLLWCIEFWVLRVWVLEEDKEGVSHVDAVRGKCEERMNCSKGNSEYAEIPGSCLVGECLTKEYAK